MGFSILHSPDLRLCKVLAQGMPIASLFSTFFELKNELFMVFRDVFINHINHHKLFEERISLFEGFTVISLVFCNENLICPWTITNIIGYNETVKDILLLEKA